ncbi:uncharacterized protein LOC110943106 [Helianthus annuus]|uniref:uncharacterized protein LOC110943106 n=1 Tax=Helianthus annuus TaxID=4232 RepID=UPI000B903C9F|nr:uncharacterized protein LOC110943106 [Helianthus annuus]
MHRIITKYALNIEDSLCRGSKQSIGMREFQECIQQTELMDINAHGLQYTWNQKPRSGVGLLKKIDRIMGNVTFLDLFPSAYALFHPFRVSDHIPCILKILGSNGSRPKPFKFPNFIATKPEFKSIVTLEWTKSVEGIAMLSVVKKLRNLKPKLRKLLFDQGNLHVKVENLRKELDEIQAWVDRNPWSAHLRQRESQCLKDFQVAAYDEECFLKQKSKVEWLCAGDSNTKYFHNIVKSRNARARIYSVMDTMGARHEGEDVADAMVMHYSNFLGMEDSVETTNLENLFTSVLSDEDAVYMIRPITREEVKNAMFSIGEDKAPGGHGLSKRDAGGLKELHHETRDKNLICSSKERGDLGDLGFLVTLNDFKQFSSSELILNWFLVGVKGFVAANACFANQLDGDH